MMANTQNTESGTIRKRSKRSSMIAMCTAPFVTKQRSQIEQEIRLDEPFRQYAPGDRIKGAIHVTFTKPMRITHLVIRTHGFVKLFNRAKLPGQQMSYDDLLLESGNGKGRQGAEHLGRGYARLFEDEEVLCGEGRVSGLVLFRFETVLPTRNIPSSIDFEHGTIAYFITSTVTRPTAMAPTTVQHLKLRVQESIDIAPIQKPIRESVKTEVLNRKGKPKIGNKSRSLLSANALTSKCSSRDSTNGIPTTHTFSPQLSGEPPRSPVGSEVSSTTLTTNGSSSNPTSSGEALSGTIDNGTEDTKSASDENVLTTRTELLQGACLAGDALPVRISVTHNKPIKGMEAVIITLYRQCRVNIRPIDPPDSSGKTEKERNENFYPRSRTGLGGLSFSSAGSTRLFRQDLNQSILPLIINPHTLTANINTSIIAPAHIFPTIRNVPGDLVSFKYFVEIVVDLRGKLSGPDRILPHLNIIDVPQHGYGDPKVSRVEGSESINYYSAPSFHFLHTDQLRRAKPVASTKSEVIVGTRDSARKRGKQFECRARTLKSTPSRNSDEIRDTMDTDDRNFEGERRNRLLGDQREQCVHEDPRTTVIPLPAPEEGLDEKAQMRRAEQMLLPSAPPQDNGGPSVSNVPTPSAPPARDEEDFNHRYALIPPAPAYDGPSAAFAESHGSPEHHVLGSPAPGQPSAAAGDDKQELERQRLLALASSPEPDDDEAGVVARISQSMAPSAPVLHEDGLCDVNDPCIPKSLPAGLTDGGIAPEALQSNPTLLPSFLGKGSSDRVHESRNDRPLNDDCLCDDQNSHVKTSSPDAGMHDKNISPGSG